MPSIDALIRSARAEATLEYVRASGPGGQNVNKVATSAQLRFDVAGARGLPEEVKRRLARLGGKRMSSDGVLIIEARRYRTQEQNRQDAMQRLEQLLRRAFVEPKRRLPTKSTAASRERRLTTKKLKGKIKKVRQDRTFED